MLGQALSSSESAIKPPPKSSEIDNQISFCDRESGRSGELIIKLSSKLSPILRQLPPEKGEAKAEPNLTPLAEKIRSIGYGFKLFGDEIESILERLEL